ncbi:uncharacterized protein TNCV_3796291 [Trichonephila clavipes]|nr:uncharacterized protein TNCV_3796291 [Trichonephila clavipes]
MENTHRRPSGKRPKKRRFRGNQFMKVCSHTHVAERKDTSKCASSNKISGIQTSLKSNLVKEVAEESMKRAAVEENSSSPDNLLTVSGDGTWKTRGHSSLIGVCTVIEAETGRLTDSLIDKLAHYYGNAIRCNSTSVKEMRKAIWAVWGHSCSTDDEPMHWFCPTNPNTWCKYNAAINNNLQNYKHKPSVAKAVRDVIKPVFADLSHPALLKKCLGGKTQNPNESLNSLIWKFCPKTIGSSLQIAEIAANLATSVFNDGNQILISILKKFGLKINRNVCVSLAERDNRRIFTARQRCLQSSFEARRAKKIKKSKEIELFQEQEGKCYNPGASILDLWHRTATAGSDVVQSGRPIFDDFFQHLWSHIGNNTANIVFQMVKRLWLIRLDQ